MSRDRSLAKLRRLLRSPKGRELEIGHALDALTPEDIGRVGYAGLTDASALTRREGCEGWRGLVRREIGVSEPTAGELSAVA